MNLSSCVIESEKQEDSNNFLSQKDAAISLLYARFGGLFVCCVRACVRARLFSEENRTKENKRSPPRTLTKFGQKRGESFLVDACC
jgi:hypothetical protein